MNKVAKIVASAALSLGVIAGTTITTTQPASAVTVYRLNNDCESDHWIVVSNKKDGVGARTLLSNCEKSPFRVTRSFYINPKWPGECWVAHVNQLTGRVMTLYTTDGWHNIRMVYTFRSNLEVLC